MKDKIITTLAFILFIFTATQNIAQPYNKDSLLQCITASKDGRKKTDAMVLLSYEYRRSNRDSLMYYALQVKALSDKLNYTVGKAGYYKCMMAYVFMNNPDSASMLGDMATELYKQANDTVGMLAMQNNRVTIDLLLGKYESAFQKAQLLIEYYSQYPESNAERNKRMAELHQHLSNIYIHKSFYDSAIYYATIALQIAEKNSNHATQSSALSCLSVIYDQFKEYNNCIGISKKAIELYRTLGDMQGMAQAQSNIAKSYFQFGNYSMARMHADTAIRISKENEQFRYLGLAYMVLGQLEAKQQNYDYALALYDSGLVYAEQTNNDYLVASLLLQKGVSFNSQKNSKQAIEELNKSNAIYKEQEDLEGTLLTNQYLAEAYFMNGNPAQAYALLKQAMQLSDTIFNETKQMAISRLQFQYETEKKEEQLKAMLAKNKLIELESRENKNKRNVAIGIAGFAICTGFIVFYLFTKKRTLSNQLNQSLQQLRQTQAQLIATEKEKEAENIRLRISRDIHDDIGNGLTKIVMMSNLVQHESAEEAKHTQSKIASAARQVNASLSEIVWAISPKQDSLESLMAYMRNHINAFFEKTSMEYHIQFDATYGAMELRPETKRNIFLVLKEALNNIAKYAEAKNVHIAFTVHENRFEMKIADDGNGMDVLQSFEKGHGLNNMKYRMKAIGAEFSIQSKPGNTEINVKGNLP